LNIDDEKARLRSAALERRATLTPFGCDFVSEFLDQFGFLRPGAEIAGYWPMRGELDIRELLHALHARGFGISLPFTPKRGEGLEFRRWTPDATLITGRFGTVHTDGKRVWPKIVLVPCLAFDIYGNRLGYGGGYYDRTLYELTGHGYVIVIGCAYEGQEVKSVPIGPYDFRLDTVLTDRGVLTLERRPAKPRHEKDPECASCFSAT
jgi:5-formyltetrahydrofolate cyclo-ligase